MKGLTLSIIDTPGFNDTSGIAQDACNITSIKNFFATLNTGENFFPNIVLLCIMANDTRFAGENSLFSKSLKAIKRLGIVDQNKPNVVIVFTFACAITPKQRKNNFFVMKGKKANEILFKTTGVTAPVVWIENEYDDYDLETQGAWTILPDGVLQPKNLYDAVKDVLKKNRDHFGLLAINRFFLDNGTGKPFVGLSVAAKDSSKDTLDSEELGMRQNIEKDANMEEGMPEVSKKIMRYVKDNKIEGVSKFFTSHSSAI